MRFEAADRYVSGAFLFFGLRIVEFPGRGMHMI